MSDTNNYFERASKFEGVGDIAMALRCMVSASMDSSRAKMLDMILSNTDRLLRIVSVKAEQLFNDLKVQPIAESRSTPFTYQTDVQSGLGLLPLLSLTTISSRIERVERTIDTILAQSSKFHSINLFVSDEPFLIDEGIPTSHPAIRRIASRGVNVYLVPNIGPYRKQYPILRVLNESGANLETPFVTLDDDVLYPVDALKNLMERANAQDCVVAHRGRELVVADGGILGSYNAAFTPSKNVCIRNLGTGKNGIVYRLKYFSSHPQTYVGPLLAPTADDIWCKWVTTVNCVPTCILSPRAIEGADQDYVESDPLDKVALWHRYNASGNNDTAMMNLETYFTWLRTSAGKIMSYAND